jgi:hypothetical protein
MISTGFLELLGLSLWALYVGSGYTLVVLMGSLFETGPLKTARSWGDSMKKGLRKLEDENGCLLGCSAV